VALLGGWLDFSPGGVRGRTMSIWELPLLVPLCQCPVPGKIEFRSKP
jgi:hypothetical protein